MQVILLFIISSALAQKSNNRPNFIFILTDDQRFELLGANGNQIIQTPNLDQLAKEGVLFTNAHVTSAICTPSRVSILLSQFERKHGVNFNSGTAVSKEAWKQSYPVIMRENGYYTGYIGKNHSPIGEGGYSSGVMEKSFDYWYGAHGHLFFYPKEKHKIFNGAQNDTQAEILNEGINDFFSNEFKLKGAEHFLKNRPVNQPFCLNINFNLPHGAATSRMEQRESDSTIYKTLYRDIDIPLPTHYIAKKDIKTQKLPEDLLFTEARQLGYDFTYTPETMKERKLRHMQAVTGIDALVGRLRAKLEQQGLAKNTIIVFTSDHGLFWGEFGMAGKAMCYEVCTRVPFIVYNPMAPKKAREKVSNALVQTIDVAPTLLDYAGIQMPEHFQGKSIRKIIDGQSSDVHAYLYTENLWSNTFGNPRCEAVQNKIWKYIRYYRNDNMKSNEIMEMTEFLGINRMEMLYKIYLPEVAKYRAYIENPLRGEQPVFEELYNLSEDPDEITNLAFDKNHAIQIKHMREIWKEKIKYARGNESPKVVLKN
ncbi:acetylglucosamine-6-sulfatase [Flavivirga rizhaonensis]|uniref:Acetylglucosamine-6-sulfatase n=2 Tax=Flavivirga rizhaonensis TaxID=2559571 RepID=A0A4S1DT88_9FLAO|nr:acetylglucosamine-6-sulfatase [Flavivirga rizhaonensis]